MSRPTHEHDRARDGRATKGADAVGCPICGREVAPSSDTFPFCTTRCRTIDLGRWLDGKYVISRPLTDDDLANLG